MRREKETQIHRILSLYERLIKGQLLNKREEANRFHSSEKSIQRDIDSIRKYLELEKSNEYIDYDYSKKAYMLETDTPIWFQNEEIFAILKVLIESRAFPKQEMDKLLDKLINMIKKDNQTVIKQMIASEKFHYMELTNKKNLLTTLWQLSVSIQQKKVIRIEYKKEFDEHPNSVEVKPVGIIFSEYYFYLIAYLLERDYTYPTVYRIDRIEKFEQTTQIFNIPYHERFQEGEFRKRVQFMYSGELFRIKFKFTGYSPQAVIDRLPTAKVIEILKDGIIFEAEIFGKGIKMWLLSQGVNIEVLEPESLRDEMIQEFQEMINIYRK